MQGGQAAKLGVYEYDTAIGLNDDIVNVEVAGGVANPGDVETVVAIMEISGQEDVLETPELIERTHPQCLAIGPQPHTAVEGSFENTQAAVAVQPDKYQLAGLVGGAGQANPLVGQPS